MIDGRIRIVELEHVVRWVLEDAEGAPILVGDPQVDEAEALHAIARARRNARDDERYRRHGSGFALVDECGIVLARREALFGARARELAIASTKRQLVHAPLELEP